METTCCWCDRPATVFLVARWAYAGGLGVPRTAEIRDPACSECADRHGATYDEIRTEWRGTERMRDALAAEAAYRD